MCSNKPGPVCTMAAAGADWEKVAPEEVRGTCGRAGPYGEPGAAAGWADPRSGTPAWAGWCAWAGRGAVCAGCESGSCVEAEEAQRSGETAAKVMRGSFFLFFFSPEMPADMCHVSSQQYTDWSRVRVMLLWPHFELVLVILWAIQVVSYRPQCLVQFR